MVELRFKLEILDGQERKGNRLVIDCNGALAHYYIDNSRSQRVDDEQPVLKRVGSDNNPLIKMLIMVKLQRANQGTN